MQNYLQGLNEQQHAAVTHINGPLMIVAGAGSGKTKVLTTRIAHLMSKGVDAFNILALTFTNKAAAEMKERIGHMLGSDEARNLFIGTFHSVFARILRSEAHKLGYPNNFTIYDSDDSKGVLKTVIQELELDAKDTYKPNVVLNRISAAKNALISADEYVADTFLLQEDARNKRPAIGKIYKAYVDRCYKNGAMDFDDLLFKMHELLRFHNDCLHKYQHKFKYVLIDEYQDTNPVQYQIAKLLAAVHENICVVGDDAQSIYSFRGATIENILQFQKDYNDVTVVKLEQNYRSTKTILNAANQVINNNLNQLPKELWTENKQGDKIKLVKTFTDNDEGKFVADTIKEEKLRNHFNNQDFAILYRTNAQSRAFEECLRRQGINYKIYGGQSFYQRKEIKDFLAYLRLISNTKDEEALKRIINYPARGIGKTSIEKLIVLANEKDITLFEAVETAEQLGFKGNALATLKDFALMVKYFKTLAEKSNAYEVAVQIGKHTQLVKTLFEDKTSEGLSRYENVQALLNSIKEWTESADNEDGEVGEKSVGIYLQQISLLTDADNDKDDPDTVKLMSIHASKGLEFECVFVVGVEENIFPGALSINTREELEEERRLFYVAVTRAKQKLWLSHASSRYKFGQITQNQPSRFLAEMPTEFLDKSFAGSGASQNFAQGSAYERMQGLGFGKSAGFNDAQLAEKRYGAPPNKTEKARPTYLAPKTTHSVVEHKPTANFVSSDLDSFKEGDTVEHQKFGFGKITRLEKTNKGPMALIHFNNNGERNILLAYAKLRIVE